MPRETVYKPIEKTKQIFTGGGLEPPKFMPSYLEWLFKKGESIHLVTLTFAAAETIYTVPANKTLYMTSYYVQGAITGAVSFVTISLWTTNLPQTHFAAQLIRYLLTTTSQGRCVVMNPSFPLKIPSKAKIIMGVSEVGKSTAFGGFAGFLVNKKDLLEF